MHDGVKTTVRRSAERHGKWTGFRRALLIFPTDIEKNFAKGHGEKTENVMKVGKYEVLLERPGDRARAEHEYFVYTVRYICLRVRTS